MTNGEAVNWLINISADIGKAEHSDLWHYEQALSEIREMLESAQPEQRWIPCSDDVPKEYGNYLITEMPMGGFEVEPYVATYYPDDDEWTTSSPFRIVRRPVIAWMPLPEPYKERREE